MTLDDAIAALPGLRRFRFITADDLRRFLERQRGECTWCGVPVPKGRQTWCSDECVTAFKLRCDSAHQVTVVASRDRGICCLCGRDTLKCQRVYRAYWRDAKHIVPTDHGEVQEALGIKCHFTQPFEVDHVVPVVEGGGLCGPDGLRTLCRPCHKQKSAELARRRRKVRQ